MAKIKIHAFTSSINRIRKLVLLQIGDKIRDFKQGDTKKIAFKCFLFFVLIAAITSALIFFFYYLKNMYALSLSKNLMTTMIFFTQIFAVFSCVGNISQTLYYSKENMILLTYPCNHNDIFISKLFVFIFIEMKKSLFFLLPFLISFGMSAKMGFLYYLILPICWIILCALPVNISALLSTIIVPVKRYLKKHPLLSAFFSLVIIASLFVLAVFVLAKVPTPIRIAAVYGRFMNNLNFAFIKINKFALLYNKFGELLFLEKIYINLPIWLAVFLASIVLCYLIAMPFYFKNISRSREFSTATKKTRLKPAKNLYCAFLKKETKLLFRNTSLLNSITEVIFLFPLITFVLNFIVANIATSTRGDFLIIGFNVMINISLLSVYNSNCACSLSREGSEFALLKTAPTTTRIITWAKITISSIVNLLAVSASLVMLSFTTRLPLKDVLLTGTVVLFVSLAHMITSYQFDIMNPQLIEYIEKGDNVVDNKNVAKSIVWGFVIATIAGLLTILLLFDAYVSGWVRIVLIAAFFLAARIYLYVSHLVVYYNDIQM